MGLDANPQLRCASGRYVNKLQPNPQRTRSAARPSGNRHAEGGIPFPAGAEQATFNTAQAQDCYSWSLRTLLAAGQ